MATMSYFPVTGNYATFAPGTALRADVLFTPVFHVGDIAKATGLTPSTGFVPTPVRAKIVGGVLVGLDGSPVTLASADPDLNLTTPLYYAVTFSNVSATRQHATLTGITVDTQHAEIAGLTFPAPTDSSSVDLVAVAPAPGAVAATGASSQVGTVLVSTGSEARPATTGTVLWIGGTTEPTHIAAGDVWLSAVTTGTTTVAPAAMLSAKVMTNDNETYTIVSGTVTTINGSILQGVPIGVGDYLLVAGAQAASGQGGYHTTQPANGLYVATAVGTNISVSRAPEMSGTNSPAGKLVYIARGNQGVNGGYGGQFYSVNLPLLGTSFTYGTDNVYINDAYNSTAAILDTVRYTLNHNRVVATITSAVTIHGSDGSPNDSGEFVTFIGNGGAPTLPTAVGNTSRYAFKNIHTTSKTILTSSSQTIDGNASATLAAGASINLISDGANWRSI